MTLARDHYRDTAQRLSHYVASIAKRYPRVWQDVDRLRALRGNTLPDWPDWCFMPLAGFQAIVSHYRQQIAPATVTPQEELRVCDRLDMVAEAQVLAALAAWRVTQGIYYYDPDVFTHVATTPLGGPLPVELLHQLPEWCCYVLMPTPLDAIFEDLSGMYGFFVHLEYDVNNSRTELRFLCDYGAPVIKEGDGPGLVSYILHLKTGETLQQAWEGFLEELRTQFLRIDTTHDMTLIEQLRSTTAIQEVLRCLVSLTLYLCSVNAEIQQPLSGRRIQRGWRPTPKIVRGAPRLFPPSQPSPWEVGYRVGAALRRADQQSFARSTGDESTQLQEAGKPRKSPVSHIRRAHWHSYWTGRRNGERTLVVKWLPPILVGAKDKEQPIVPTIRQVF